jgi:hypothetical protein
LADRAIAALARLLFFLDFIFQVKIQVILNKGRIVFLKIHLLRIILQTPFQDTGGNETLVPVLGEEEFLRLFKDKIGDGQIMFLHLRDLFYTHSVELLTLRV